MTLAQKKAEPGLLKCVVWDLDDTLWSGVLSESADVTLRPGVTDLLNALDARGVLNSIASRNNHDDALEKLRAFGLDTMFVAPQISWSNKAASIQAIADTLSLGLNSLAVIDNDPAERAEVALTHPDVRIFDETQLEDVLDHAPQAGSLTTESAQRRKMYIDEARRVDAERDFDGSRTAFLRSLNLKFAISPARKEDLERAEELTRRTNQLNATGTSYSMEELENLMVSPDHALIMASLEDSFGSYGKIGLAIIEKGAEVWTLKILLMSCRVISRGAGTVMLARIIARAQSAGVRLKADFIDTGRNRPLFITYRLAGFREVARNGDAVEFELQFPDAIQIPDYVDIVETNMS
ncbi:HAD-IIIC family phosphatase [Roseibium sp. Sym1]|uniref:HAD-IIIC family phosphatase n=1 Tax=Roseibium sp. Sym1 TaxID=3016006 RepID=UPI0022B56647|nr:HAD-IIIC family phosphatase [Roseibium sp. Sym1]